MLFKKIIAFIWELKFINTLCGQNLELLLKQAVE
jgi:hypothetical protein